MRDTDINSRNIPEDELTVSLCEKTYTEPYSTAHVSSEFHISDTVEISVVISGDGLHRILGEVTECHEGDAYIFNGTISHQYFAAGENAFPTVITLKWHADKCFSGEISDPSSSNFCYGVFRDKAPISYAMLNSKALSRTVSLYREMVEETESHKKWQQIAIHSRLSLMLIELSRYINMADTALTERPKEWLTASTAAMQIMERYSDGDLTLESVASSLYISKSQLSRVFQKVMGESFPDYVRNVRIQHACELLRDTELTNEEIVGKCGLKDIPSFYRLFKSVMGMTPYQYRTNRAVSEDTSGILGDISLAVQRGNVKKVQELVLSALNSGIKANDILEDGLIHAINTVGNKFKNNDVFVPEVLVAARAINTAFSTVRQYLTEGDFVFKGRVCIGTVQGDLHDIGKNLVRIMLETKGFEVIDLGTDVAAKRFVDVAIERDCQIICCSALLTTTIGVMADVVREAEIRGVRDRVKIMIGGAPASEEFCREIGADVYTSDAASAADAALKLIENK